MRATPWKVAGDRRRAGADRRLRQEGAQGAAARRRATSADAGTADRRGRRLGSDVGAGVGPGSREDFLQTVGLEGDRVFFDTDRYDLDDRDRATLDAQAAWLNRYPNVRVTIEGHADERGTRDYNLALGDRRANAAKTISPPAASRPAG